MAKTEKTYTGKCHCGALQYTITCSPIESALECNCSHCEAKGLLLIFAPRSSFVLRKGEGKFKEYRFNKGVIGHCFCTNCGTQPFSFGKSPTGEETVAVNIRTIEHIDLAAITRKPFNGKSI